MIYLDVEEKISIMKSISQEIITEEELRNLFETNDHPLAYDGFEPSGLAAMHFGLYVTNNIKKMQSIGIKFNAFVADYFAYLNNKMGGDLDKIREVGKYFMEVWKAGGLKDINVIWSSELVKDPAYWERFLKIGKAVSLDRTHRAITIMGRKEGDKLDTAQLFYPIMQVTDVFQMDIDICQLGIDQRKADILAREVAQKFGWKVPISAHHPYLLGLKGAPKDLMTMTEEEGMQYKMSKSSPSNSIFVHDSYDDIKRKINSAYCPERVIEGNPIFNYLDKIIIDDKKSPITIDRPQKYGGLIEASDYKELVKMYQEGKIHPIDMKGYAADKLEEMIKPIREYFEKNKEAKELYEKVKSYQITR